MSQIEIPDPIFRDAVSAIDTGDVQSLGRLLASHPELVRQRADCGEGYFHRPYLLWFIAENPIRNGRLPANIAEIARTIVRAASQTDDLREQSGYTLGLVCSGRVARECGVQLQLIDVLIEAGADPDDALLPALAHKEVHAAQRLLDRGAKLTLTAAICTGRDDDTHRLAETATPSERQLALTAAAFYGKAAVLSHLVRFGLELNDYSPHGFHPHGTALHQAVDSGSLEAVTVLVEAGADQHIKDRVHQGTPLEWAEYLGRTEIVAYLQAKRGP